MMKLLEHENYSLQASFIYSWKNANYRVFPTYRTKIEYKLYFNIFIISFRAETAKDLIKIKEHLTIKRWALIGFTDAFKFKTIQIGSYFGKEIVHYFRKKQNYSCIKDFFYRNSEVIHT